MARGGFDHHGVCMGDGTVIHFSASDGSKLDAVIHRSPIEEFADGGVVRVRAYGSRLNADEAMQRAESMLGQSGYHLFTNNCEHFASWCVAGEHSSAQVDMAVSATVVAGAGTVAPKVAMGIVTGAGGAAARSGPNLMSGLAAVGGSTMGGIAIVGGAGGLVAAGAMCLALRDKPTLPPEERGARRAGRYAAVGGAVAGVGGAVYAVGAMGVVGYSAVGITTGLTAIGGLVDGRMVRGTLVTLALPAVLAIIVSLLAYFTVRRLLTPPTAPAVLPEPLL